MQTNIKINSENSSSTNLSEENNKGENLNNLSNNNQTQKTDNQQEQQYKHPFLKALNDFSHITQEIREKFYYMNEQLLEKPEINTNKQIQDAICKYFFHNTIGSLLKEPFKVKSIRQVNERVFEENNYTIKLQYMKYLQCYTNQIKKFGMKEQYHNFLWNMILEDEEYTKEDQEWITELRKKMTALIALTFSELNDTLQFQNMFEIWATIYPNNLLPQHNPNKKLEESDDQDQTTDQEEEEEEDQDQNQINLKNNNNKQQLELKINQNSENSSVENLVNNNKDDSKQITLVENLIPLTESSQITEINQKRSPIILNSIQNLSNSSHSQEEPILQKKIFLQNDKNLVLSNQNEDSTNIIDLPIERQQQQPKSFKKFNKIQKKREQKIQEKQTIQKQQPQQQEYQNNQQNKEYQINNILNQSEQLQNINLYNNQQQQQQNNQIFTQQDQLLLLQLQEQQQQLQFQQLFQQQQNLQQQQQLPELNYLQQLNMMQLIQSNPMQFNNNIQQQPQFFQNQYNQYVNIPINPLQFQVDPFNLLNIINNNNNILPSNNY